MMNEMMKQCCGSDGEPNFEKMKRFMEQQGKTDCSDDQIAMMKQLGGEQGMPSMEKMKELMEKCGCHLD